MSGRSKLTKARAHHQQGQLAPAETIYNEILKTEPGHPEALNLLGVLLLQADRAGEAAQILERAAAAEPDNAETVYNMGLAQLQLGRLEDACLAFEKAVALQPDFAAAANNLGNVLRQMGRFGPAAEAYDQALESEPGRADIHTNLGFARMKLGDHQGALAAAGKALDLDPGDAEAHFTMGKVCLAAGRQEAAIDSFGRVIKLKPKDTRAHLELGTALLQLGRVDDARESYGEILKIDPAHAHARFLIAKTRTFVDGDPEIETMEALLAQLPAGDEKRIHLGFALAKAWDDGGAADKAFAHLTESNRLKRAASNYQPAEQERFFEAITETFDAGVFAGAAEDGLQDASPIFVLGMPRSGTTLVEQILASHSQVFGAGEREDLTRLAEARGFPENAAGLAADELKELGGAYVGSLQSLAADADRFTDKTPLNFLYIGLIRLCLPGAKIVHCIRNPMDNCLSCYRELFESGQDYSYDLGELGRYYRAYHRLMEHWKAVLPDFVFDLSYEDLIADVETEVRKLLSFTGLAWEDACLDFHKTKRPVRTASSVQVRQPLYKTSVDRWKRYRQHLTSLIEALGPLAGGG
jgi:tetratricopeptide (TPR) repeat protein